MYFSFNLLITCKRIFYVNKLSWKYNVFMSMTWNNFKNLLLLYFFSSLIANVNNNIQNNNNNANKNNLNAVSQSSQNVASNTQAVNQVMVSKYRCIKDENVHRFAIREREKKKGKKKEWGRERERERERNKEIQKAWHGGLHDMTWKWLPKVNPWIYKIYPKANRKHRGPTTASILYERSPNYDWSTRACLVDK